MPPPRFELLGLSGALKARDKTARGNAPGRWVPYREKP